jgi:hypothetical protein
MILQDAEPAYLRAGKLTLLYLSGTIRQASHTIYQSLIPISIALPQGGFCIHLGQSLQVTWLQTKVYSRSPALMMEMDP